MAFFLNHNASMKFLNVQSLRGIAALMVCVFHLAGHTDGQHALLKQNDPVLHWTSFGPTGVFVFFVISGFIIPYSMDKANYQLSDFITFFRKRIWRLHPPYIVVLVLTIALVLFNNYLGKTNENVSIWRVVSHLFYFTKISGLEWFNPIFWTLAIEIQYYLLLALFFSLLNSKQRWKRCLWILGLLLSTILLNDDKWVFYYIGPFVMGFALYYYLIKRINVLECLCYFILACGNIFYFVGPHWLYASIAAVLFILFIKKTPSFLNYLGEISYSLYLTHALFGGLFIYLLLPFCRTTLMSYVVLLGAILFSIFSAHFFYRLIEKRAIEWSRD